MVVEVGRAVPPHGPWRVARPHPRRRASPRVRGRLVFRVRSRTGSGYRERMIKRGRHVLSVGATGPRGAAIAHGLAARGDHPVLTARDPSKLEAIAADVGRASSSAPPPFVTADLTHGDAVERIVE